MIIDSRIGGFGDVWMRLLALYSLSRLTDSRHTIIINPALVSTARALFDERIEISHEGTGDVIYTHLGLRHLLGGLTRGRRYVLPFYWATRTLRKSVTLKNRINDFLIPGMASTGFLLLPDRTKTVDYAGLMELSALPPFAGIGVETFRRQALLDLFELQLHLQHFASDLASKNVDKIVVYPSGTGHQIVPPDWAQKNLSGAVFAFYHLDPYAIEYEKRGLTVEKFTSPEEMLQSGLGARRILCTDSFPSHFWQVQTTNVFLLMTQQTRSTVVHPAFPDSQVLAARAPCCPCLNRVRGPGHAPCDTGHSVCLTWKDAGYETALAEILSS